MGVVAYSQDWAAYDNAQCNELYSFMELLHDLCGVIDYKPYIFGRPTIPLRDMLFVSTLKVYSGFSLRRFMGYTDMAKGLGYLSSSCSYATISNYMRNKELTSMISRMIEISSLPLASVEKDFAVDSTGFGTSRFRRWFDIRFGKHTESKMWVKANVMVGVKTNIITAVELSEWNSGDSPYFKPLVEKTSRNFKIAEVCADKAYMSKDNMILVGSLGGTAYIPFRSNVTGKSRGSGSYLWKKMYHYFQFNREEFMQHYHKRSNAETAFHMIKSKFRDNVRSKDMTAQFNEVLLKILCHNICVLIQETHELGIESKFMN